MDHTNDEEYLAAVAAALARKPVSEVKCVLEQIFPGHPRLPVLCVLCASRDEGTVFESLCSRLVGHSSTRSSSTVRSGSTVVPGPSVMSSPSGSRAPSTEEAAMQLFPGGRRPSSVSEPRAGGPSWEAASQTGAAAFARRTEQAALPVHRSASSVAKSPAASPRSAESALSYNTVSWLAAGRTCAYLPPEKLVGSASRVARPLAEAEQPTRASEETIEQKKKKLFEYMADPKRFNGGLPRPQLTHHPAHVDVSLRIQSCLRDKSELPGDVVNVCPLLLAPAKYINFSGIVLTAGPSNA